MLNQLPLQWAYVLTGILLAAIVVGVWSVPKQKVMADAPDSSRWRDLRLWASGLVLIQVLIYYMFS